MKDFIATRTKMVEVPITQLSGALQFPTNLDDLNYANIYAIIAISSTEQTTSPTGRPVVAAGTLPQASLVLAKRPGSDKQFDTIPLYTLDRTLNFGDIFAIKPLDWNPSASSVKITTAGAPLAITDSFLFVFCYVPLDRELLKQGIVKEIE